MFIFCVLHIIPKNISNKTAGLHESYNTYQVPTVYSIWWITVEKTDSSFCVSPRVVISLIQCRPKWNSHNKMYPHYRIPSSPRWNIKVWFYWVQYLRGK